MGLRPGDQAQVPSRIPTGSGHSLVAAGRVRSSCSSWLFGLGGSLPCLLSLVDQVASNSEMRLPLLGLEGHYQARHSSCFPRSPVCRMGGGGFFPRNCPEEGGGRRDVPRQLHGPQPPTPCPHPGRGTLWDRTVGALPVSVLLFLSLLLFLLHPPFFSPLHTILPGGRFPVSMESQVGKGEKPSHDPKGAGAPPAGQWSLGPRRKLPPGPVDRLRVGSTHCGRRTVGSPRKEGRTPSAWGRKDIIAACMHGTRQSQTQHSCT